STMLLTGGVNATAGWAAGEIGAWYADANTDIAGKYLAHKVAHALLGCAGAAAKGDDCASGAIGGAVGEAFAEMMGHATEGPLTDAQRKQILDLSKLVAVATAAVTGHDVNAAADAAVIAVANNYLDHRKPNAAALSEKEIYERASVECQRGNEASCRTQLELAARSAQRDALLAQACAGGPTRECQGLVAEARAMGNVVWGQYGQLVWANSPDADFPLNVATIGPVQQNPAYAGAYHNQQAGSLSEGLLLTGVGGASAYVGSTATLGRLVAGAGLGGGFDAAGQGVKLHMGTQEEYRRMQTVFAMSSGALAFQLAGTPAFGNSLIRNSLIGGTVGASNTTMTNWWYGENGSVGNAFLDGFMFSGGGTAIGRFTTGQLQKVLPLFVGSKPYNPALPILLQNVKPNPYPGQAGFVLEQGISNTPSFLGSQEGGGK
ncbi:hypothetical protein GO613_22890, partial [Azoarcus communis]|uniref:DUF6862 domain-containing protein n=1 Tax=Parazoarcus communis TaxID=41977 RepID=UPI0016A25CE8